MILFAICILCAGAALVVGIDDNLPGVLLAFLSAATFVAGLVHHWRSPKPFLGLAVASVLGFVLFAILHNALEAAASIAGLPGPVRGLLAGTSVVSFLVAILLCPPAVLVGIVGAVIMWGRKAKARGAS